MPEQVETGAQKYDEAREKPRHHNGPLEKVYAYWLAGMSCDGCTISVSGATEPSLEDLLAGNIPGLPQLVLFHPVLSMEAGDAFIHHYELAAEGKLDAPYVIILEGSAVDDSLIEEPGGFWLALGAREREDGQKDPISLMEWIRRLAPGAAASIAIGTCATWGGVPAAAGNPTGAMSMMDVLGQDYCSALGLPVINVPGCAPIGDNFTETVAAILLFLQGLGPLPEFDELGRPAWQFQETVHRHCVRAGYYEEGVFAKEYGDKECLVEIGCWGPVVQCNITKRGAINHMGGCMNQGGICIGCTMPGFPDKFAPFYKKPPGAALSTNTSRAYGSLVRFMRRMTQGKQNREVRWDIEEQVPSGWAPRGKGSAFEDLVDFFYRKWQFSDSVKPGRTLPVTQYRDGWEVAPKRLGKEKSRIQ